MTITMAAAVTLKAGQLVSGAGIAVGTKVASDTTIDTPTEVVIDTPPSGAIAAGSTLTFSTPATSGCTTDTSTHVGSVTATTQPPYFISELCATVWATCCVPGLRATGIQDDDSTAGVNEACAPCEAGKYHASATGSSASAAGVCDECPAGTFQNEEGKAGCIKCEAGMLSMGSRTACRKCEAGEFADTRAEECKTCEKGTYAPSAQENGCLACAAGSSTDLMTAATQCTWRYTRQGRVSVGVG
jgi:hypothetical protein